MNILIYKKYYKIIKIVPFDINKRFNEKSKIQVKTDYIKEEPQIKNIQNTEILYYDEFELIDEEIYQSLFKTNAGAVYRTCVFINENIYIRIPSSLNPNLNSIFVIFGVLNQNNIFKSKYILEYHS